MERKLAGDAPAAGGWRLSAAIALPLLASCATLSEDRSAITSALGQATGFFAAAVGTMVGDANLTQQGLNLLAKSSQPAPGSAPSAPAAGGGRPSTGARADLDEVANRCKSIAEQRFPDPKQNVLLKRSACLYYCAYTVTGDRKYFDLYQQSQTNANSLCSVSIGFRCNDIRPIEQCNYR